MSFTPRTSLGNFMQTQWYAYAKARVGIDLPNCFTYATGRISEIVGYNQPLDPQNQKVEGAQDLWNCHHENFTQSSTPCEGALMIWQYSTWGHVAVCENSSGTAWSQSNLGKEYFEYITGNPNGYCGMYFLGYLVHKDLGNSFSTDQLIEEHAKATFTVDQLNARVNSPNGTVCRQYNTGDSVEYTHKWVGNGHRYICWYEATNLIMVAVNGNESGTEPWATFSAIEEKVELIQEEGYAKAKVDEIAIHKGSISGEVVGRVNSGDVIHYKAKCVGSEHRYIVYDNDGDCYVACSPSTERSTEWFDFYSENPNSEDGSKEEIVDASNVKHWGIDISEHNDSDLELSKYEFVIIRASYGEHTDEKLDHFVKKAEEAKIPYGLYHYSYAISDEESDAETKYFLDLVKKYNPTLGLWFDMEDADDWKKKNGVLDREHVLKFTKNFCKKVKAEGYYTGIYSSTWWFDNWLNEGLDDYDKWVAQWDSNDGDYHSDLHTVGSVHQYTSIDKETGTNIDKNAMYVDFSHYSNENKASDSDSDKTDINTQDTENLDVTGLNKLIKLLIKLLKKIF